jgi:acetyltransferase-like isoleucine patch superfamily enzyme
LGNLNYDDNRVFVGKRIKAYCKVIIEDYCYIDDDVVFGYPSDKEWNRMLKVMRKSKPDFHKNIHQSIKSTTVRIKKGTIIRKGVLIGNNSIISEYCDIEPYVKIGSNCKVGRGSNIKVHTSIGDDNCLGENLRCGEGVRIGNGNVVGRDAKLFRNTVISHFAIIGDYARINGYICNHCKLGNNVSMLGSLMHKYRIPIGGRIEKPCVLEDDVTVGMEASIIGVTLRKGSYIGAGAVVTKDVPPNVVFAGVPAKKIR